MSKAKRGPVFEGTKASVPTLAGNSSPSRRPSVFERLGPGSSTIFTKAQQRKSGDGKHKTHDKSSDSGHTRDSGGVNAVDVVSHHSTSKKIKKKRSRSRDKKELISEVRSKISFRSNDGGDRKIKNSPNHSPSPKKTITSESRRKEPEAKIRSQVAVVTNRQNQSNTKQNEKGSNQPNEADWRTDRSHLDFQEEFILEKKRQQLQRELELEMQKERLEEKRVSSSTSVSSSSSAASSSSSSGSSSSSSSSSSSEEDDSSSISSLNCSRKTKLTSKRPVKTVSSHSGSNSEPDIIRTKKLSSEVKTARDVHSLKSKSPRNVDKEPRRDVSNQDRKKKSLVASHDPGNRNKSSPALSSEAAFSSVSGKHKSSRSSTGFQMKGSEKSKKTSAMNVSSSHKETTLYNEAPKIRERSISPRSLSTSTNKLNRAATTKMSTTVKVKYGGEGARVSNKVKSPKSSLRPKSLSVADPIRTKTRLPAADDGRAKLKASSPKSDVSRSRRTPPHVSRINEAHHSSSKQESKEKHLSRHSITSSPPASLKTNENIDKSRGFRDRHSLPNSETTKSTSDQNRKSVKDQKERKRESSLGDKNDNRGRDDSRNSRLGHDSHHLHVKSEPERGKERNRHRDSDSHSHPSDRGRLNEPKGPHSPTRRDKSDGKKSERSSIGSHQQSNREGIIDRLRDLSRTSLDECRGRRDSSGRGLPDASPERRSLLDDRSSRAITDRDRRSRIVTEEQPRYGTPELADHRRRPLSPHSSKYHSRNLTPPPPRPTTPTLPPRHWPRDHPEAREPAIPYPSDRRKSPSSLPHHYDSRNYTDVDVYDCNRSEHRSHDHLSQRRESYHTYLPSDEPLDAYDRDVSSRSRQDYGHVDQRRDDYRWERDDRLKGDQERVRDNERWPEEDISAKRKRGRDDLPDRLPLTKRRRLTPTPTSDNQRASRSSTLNDTNRPNEGGGRKRLSCESSSSSNRGTNSRTANSSEGTNKTSNKGVLSTQSSDKGFDRSKRRSDTIKDSTTDSRSSKNEDNRQKRPRTPDKIDRPAKMRKESPSRIAVKDDRQIEKSSAKDAKIEKVVTDKENLQNTNEKEDKFDPINSEKPPSPLAQTTESFSDWTDDSMDLLNQEEKAENTDTAATTCPPVDVTATGDTNVSLTASDGNKEVNVKEEKPALQAIEKKEETNLSLLKDERRRRKPKSEGGDDSRGSFEDGSREGRGRDRHRDSSRPSKSTSLERSTRRSRYHDLDFDKSRSKASTPGSRSRTPVSRPRTPACSPPRSVTESTVAENAKKHQSKPVESASVVSLDPVDNSNALLQEEKASAVLDDYEYDPISDDELEAIMEESDVKSIENEPPSKLGSADVLDVDWASLLSDKYKSHSVKETNKQSVLKKFTPASILYQIGVSAKYAGAELMERIGKVMTEEYSAGVTEAEQLSDCKTDVPTSKFSFEDEVASFHAVAIAQKIERESILDDIGPYRKALCARRDLKIRSKLCKLKLKETSSLSFHNMDVDTFKLSMQLFRQRRNCAGPV